MELTEEHKGELNKYLEFFSRKKEEAVNEVEIVADEFKTDAIEEELYNRQEVKDLIDSFSEKIKEHYGTEIGNIVRLTGVYMKYCVSIAQQAGANVNINLNLIEDAKLRAKMSIYEDGGFQRSMSMGMKLPPVAYGNQLQVKIENLQDELKESKARADKLEKELLKAKKALEVKGADTSGIFVGEATGGNYDNEDVDDLKMRVRELEQLLDQKISGSAQMQNLKKMLMSKNNKLKSLKVRLQKYEDVQ